MHTVLTVASLSRRVVSVHESRSGDALRISLRRIIEEVDSMFGCHGPARSRSWPPAVNDPNLFPAAVYTLFFVLDRSFINIFIRRSELHIGASIKTAIERGLITDVESLAVKLGCDIPANFAKTVFKMQESGARRLRELLLRSLPVLELSPDAIAVLGSAALVSNIRSFLALLFRETTQPLVAHEKAEGDAKAWIASIGMPTLISATTAYRGIPVKVPSLASSWLFQLRLVCAIWYAHPHVFGQQMEQSGLLEFDSSRELEAVSVHEAKNRSQAAKAGRVPKPRKRRCRDRAAARPSSKSRTDSTDSDSGTESPYHTMAENSEDDEDDGREGGQYNTDSSADASPRQRARLDVPAAATVPAVFWINGTAHNTPQVSPRSGVYAEGVSGEASMGVPTDLRVSEDPFNAFHELPDGIPDDPDSKEEGTSDTASDPGLGALDIGELPLSQPSLLHATDDESAMDIDSFLNNDGSDLALSASFLNDADYDLTVPAGTGDATAIVAPIIVAPIIVEPIIAAPTIAAPAIDTPTIVEPIIAAPVIANLCNVVEASTGAAPAECDQGFAAAAPKTDLLPPMRSVGRDPLKPPMVYPYAADRQLRGFSSTGRSLLISESDGYANRIPAAISVQMGAGSDAATADGPLMHKQVIPAIDPIGAPGINVVPLFERKCWIAPIGSSLEKAVLVCMLFQHIRVIEGLERIELVPATPIVCDMSTDSSYTAGEQVLLCRRLMYMCGYDATDVSGEFFIKVGACVMGMMSHLREGTLAAFIAGDTLNYLALLFTRNVNTLLASGGLHPDAAKDVSQFVTGVLPNTSASGAGVPGVDDEAHFNLVAHLANRSISWLDPLTAAPSIRETTHPSRDLSAIGIRMEHAGLARVYHAVLVNDIMTVHELYTGCHDRLRSHDDCAADGYIVIPSTPVALPDEYADTSAAAEESIAQPPLAATVDLDSDGDVTMKGVPTTSAASV
jgi:hypothetical protein